MADNDFIQPPFPSPTQRWHNRVYSSIDATRPELSLKGKTVLITGAGSGIGRETAKAFAAAGASTIHLLGGRREGLLHETQEAVHASHPHTQVTVYSGDISNHGWAKTAVATIDGWDVLVLNACYLPKPAKLLDADLDDWAKAWDVSLKGNLELLQGLLPKRNPGASVIGTSSIIINLDPPFAVGLAPYALTKMAMSKMFEVFSVEVPDVHWVTFHPGSGRFGGYVMQGYNRSRTCS